MRTRSAIGFDFRSEINPSIEDRGREPRPCNTPFPFQAKLRSTLRFATEDMRLTFQA
jgi:hypothetical protein